MPEKTKKFPHSNDSTGTEYLIPALIGIIGGFIAVVIPLWIGIVSTSTIRTVMLHEFFAEFSYAIGKIPQLQVFLILLIGTTFLGFIIPCIHYRYIQKMADAIRAGIISGVCTGIVISGFFILMPVIFHDYFDMDQYRLLIVSAVLLSLVFETIGAIGGYLWYRNRSPVPSAAEADHLTGIAAPGVVAIILMVLVLAVPMTFPKVDYHKCSMSEENLNVERLSEDTLKITQLRANSPEDCLSDKPYINKISLDGWDVSDMASIQKQGLAVTIDPPEGFVYANGSTVVLKGPMVSNKTHKPLLQIMKYMQNPDGSLTALRGTANGHI